MVDISLFGEKIKRHREYLHFNSYNFAVATNISYSYLSNIESGSVIPSTKTVVSILNVLNMTFNECIKCSNNNLKEAYGDIISNSLDSLEEIDLNFIFNIAKLINLNVLN